MMSKDSIASPRPAHHPTSSPRKLNRSLALLALALVVCALSGCGPDKSKMSDAQLGLNAEQSAGRQIYNQRCAACHYAYSSRGSKGPSLKGLFQRKYLPSGLPANDRFVTQTIINGRGMMPAAGYTLSDDQLRALLAYLHTL